MAMMFEKPKRKRQKSRHHSNTRITEYYPCEIRKSERCTGYAVDNHEWFNGTNRTKSAKLGAQAKVCWYCHRWLEEDKERWLPWRQEHQRRIMKEEGWSIDRFIKEFGKSYL